MFDVIILIDIIVDIIDNSNIILDKIFMLY